MKFALYISNIEFFDKLTNDYIIKIQEKIKSNRYLQELSKIENFKFERIYFGSEFCTNLIPDLKEIKKVVDFCEKNKLKLTFLTPFVTPDALKKIKKLLIFFKEKNMNGFEIVFNDWGLFHFLKERYSFKLSMGRLLTKQKKDPSFIEDLFDSSFLNLNEDTKLIIKECSMDCTDLLKNFILKNKISRIELDNVYQGINIDFDIKKSLYYPFVPVTLTRFCKAHSYYSKKAYIRGKNPCNKECLKSHYSHVVNNVRLFLKGNTQFYCNNLLPKNIKIFDRIVFEPTEIIL